jgi:Kef-type K+ transport system membrane component KefB
VADFFAELGELLLMFFVGLEVDLQQFTANWLRSLFFGLLTFARPMAAGTTIGLTFGYNPIAATLIGSLIASHTLIAYPIVEAGHQATRPSATITVGATILTDILSLLVLTMCVTTFRSGFHALGLVLQLSELIGFVLVIVVGLGTIGKSLFDRFGRTDDAGFALLLVIVSIAATLAEVIQLEGILGAFLAGLAVNAAVRSSPAKETVGRIWRFGLADRGLMGSLTLPQVAATLAAALVGFQTVTLPANG